MSILRTALLAFSLLLASSAGEPVEAQMPPHPAGTICFTPQFWCWAQFAGPPGNVCYCPTPYGWVPGRLA